MRRAVEPVTWDDVTKKGARGVTDESDFGEVHEIGRTLCPNTKGSKKQREIFHSEICSIGI